LRDNCDADTPIIKANSAVVVRQCVAKLDAFESNESRRIDSNQGGRCQAKNIWHKPDVTGGGISLIVEIQREIERRAGVDISINKRQEG
jgi:hypothetical protein